MKKEKKKLINVDINRSIFIWLIFSLCIMNYSCGSKTKTTILKDSMLISDLKFQEWFYNYNGQFLPISFENEVSLTNTFFLKKQFNKLYIVEVSTKNSTINYFPLLNNCQRKEVIDMELNNLFPYPNIMQKDLKLHSYFSDNRDILYIDFYYSSRLSHEIVNINEKEKEPEKYTHNLKISFESGKFHIDLGKNVSSLWE